MIEKPLNKFPYFACIVAIHNNPERGVSKGSVKTKLAEKGRGQARPHHLNLAGWEVTDVSQLETHLRLKIEMVNPLFPHHCSPLGEVTVADNPSKFGFKTVNIPDLPLNGEYVDLQAKRPRLRCRRCGKAGAAHADRDLGKDIHSRHRMTKRLIEYIQVQAATRTFRELGREVGLPEATVRTIFKEDGPPTNLAMAIKAPRVLGIDDKHTTGRRKKTVFVDLEEGHLLDVYDENAAKPLEPFVKCLDNPRRIVAVCIDMSGTYLSFCRDYLPWASVVIDKFHVLMKANDAVNTVRIQAQKKLLDDKKRELSSLKQVFLRRRPITRETRASMSWWMINVPELGAAWEAKERFYGFYSQESAEKANEYYEKWLKSLDGATRSQFKVLTTCMKNHRNEILNYFRVTKSDSGRYITNGYLEALNLQIERILYQAPSYNFETLRHKLLKAYGADQKSRVEFSRRGLKAGGRRRRRRSSKPQSFFEIQNVSKVPAQNKNSKDSFVQIEMFSSEQLAKMPRPKRGERTKD